MPQPHHDHDHDHGHGEGHESQEEEEEEAEIPELVIGTTGITMHVDSNELSWKVSAEEANAVDGDGQIGTKSPQEALDSINLRKLLGL